jgi:NADH-quinone oxidoreductase subunit N
MNEFLTLMKSELVLTLLIFLLLFVKIGRGMHNGALLPIIQVLLLVNFIAGFFFNGQGSLFGGMFHTSALIAFEKNILSLAVYLVSLLFAGWLKKASTCLSFFC